MKLPKYRIQGSYDLEAASNEAAYVETMPSLTIQSQSEDADLNVIMKRVGLGAPMPQNLKIPEYGDFEGIKDFRTALEAVQRAETEFMKLPANIRSTFQNDPQAFLEHVQNPANLQSLVDMGLATPKATIPVPNATAQATNDQSAPSETRAKKVPGDNP